MTFSETRFFPDAGKGERTWADFSSAVEIFSWPNSRFKSEYAALLYGISHALCSGIHRAPEICRMVAGKAASKLSMRTAMQSLFSKMAGAIWIFMWSKKITIREPIREQTYSTFLFLQILPSKNGWVAYPFFAKQINALCAPSQTACRFSATPRLLRCRVDNRAACSTERCRSFDLSGLFLVCARACPNRNRVLFASVVPHFAAFMCKV